ncbi:MAG TPA: type II/IV secretion system ATPase subunit, partial [Nitrososphaerales archaeon]|nr:type II/IV secretion system ATPase subunit [Nitrososphaerales archaeon]
GEIKDRKEFINRLVEDHQAGPGMEIPDASREVLRYYLARDVAGYGVLDVLMNDQDVEEVECGGFSAPITVVHRDFTEYLRLETNIALATEEVVAETVQKLAQRAGKSVTTAYPYADFLLPEGHRGSATFSNEISLPGSTFDIRKFPENPLTIINLIKAGTLSPLLAAYQWLVMENRGFTLVIGPVSSGKTTMLNTMMSTLQPSAKIITVEDTPELKIVHQNWIRLITRSAYTLGAREVGLFDLVKASLRYRPDYLVVGEVRGAEIQSLVQAAAVGHGALTTLHADSPEAAIVRMRSPPLSVGESFLLLIWNFLQMTRPTLSNGKQVRRVTAVTELVPDSDTMNFRLQPIFEWDPITDSYTPGDAAEVVRRCSRLKTVMALRGWTNQGIAEELNQRALFLQGLVEEGVYNYKDVAAKIFSYYENRRRLEVDFVQK